MGKSLLRQFVLRGDVIDPSTSVFLYIGHDWPELKITVSSGDVIGLPEKAVINITALLHGVLEVHGYVYTWKYMADVTAVIQKDTERGIQFVRPARPTSVYVLELPGGREVQFRIPKPLDSGDFEITFLVYQDEGGRR